MESWVHEKGSGDQQEHHCQVGVHVTWMMLKWEATLFIFWYLSSQLSSMFGSVVLKFKRQHDATVHGSERAGILRVQPYARHLFVDGYKATDFEQFLQRKKY